jgi:hypothetical protein
MKPRVLRRDLTQSLRSAQRQIALWDTFVTSRKYSLLAQHDGTHEVICRER